MVKQPRYSSARAQRVALVALVVGSLAMVACTKADTGSSTVRAPVPVRVAKIERGSIASTLAYSGELQPEDQVEVLAFSAGRVQEVYVDEGAEVGAGTPLALLEPDTFNAQVKQAEANLLSAQARLETVLQGARPEEIAASQAQLDAARARLAALEGGDGGGVEAVARANLASASVKVTADQAGAEAGVTTGRANLATAEARLRQILNPTPEDMAGAEAAVTAAMDGVGSQRAKLLLLKNPTQLDIAAADAALAAAVAAQQSADAKLQELRDGPKAAEIAGARASVAGAETALRRAESSLANLREPLNEEKVKILMDAYLELARARLRVEEERARGAPPATMAAAEAAVATALARLESARIDAGSYEVGVSVEEIFEAEAAVKSARSNLESAQASLQETLDGATEAELQSAQAASDRAKADVDSARIRLDKLRNPTAADMAAAEAAVTQAESQLVTAQNRLTTLHTPTAVDLQVAQSAVDNAAASLQAAEAKLTQLVGGGSAAELESARSALVRAAGDVGVQVAAVAQAEQQFAQVANRYTGPDVTAATAAVAQAEAALEIARINLVRATLTAPFDAIVARKNVSKGSNVTGQTAVFSLVSRTNQLVFNVEEATVGRLRTGQLVSFNLAAGGSRPFRGRITSISPTAEAASRTFRVRVAPEPGQEGLRAGMFANLSVSLEALEGVLMVPQEAIVQRGEETVVYVVRDDTVEQRKVTLGLRNDRQAQVRSGVEEGEEVVVQGNRSLRNEDRVSVVR